MTVAATTQGPVPTSVRQFYADLWAVRRFSGAMSLDRLRALATSAGLEQAWTHDSAHWDALAALWLRGTTPEDAAATFDRFASAPAAG
ncbi:hypothetical protein D9V37_12195 [Nocardioides mangrovicus]|uniref:Uncharacterized protein n=1 Tax=Nocardioides mangrovicus TaxID=2478913 RepID=A0A3L8P2T5_9ACTN|nr:hypothetical protein [Nocardioides mangrovicus]RLV49297.1 hypothetical protein D9V37_12195 [Nocardioides mangrovicus]